MVKLLVYDVEIGGHKTRQRLSDEEAKARGLTPVPGPDPIPPTGPPDPEPPPEEEPKARHSVPNKTRQGPVSTS